MLVTSGATTTLWDPTLPRVVVVLPQTPAARAELSPDGSRIVIAGKNRLQVVACDACAPLPEDSSGALARFYPLRDQRLAKVALIRVRLESAITRVRACCRRST